LVGLLLAAFQKNLGYAGEPGAAYVRSAEISTRAPAADAQSHAQRGLALLNRGNFDEAIAEYSTAISSDPSDAGALIGRGRAYAAKDQYDKAIADFDKAIRLAPQDSTAFRYRGLVNSLKGQPDRAIRDLDEAIRRNPQDFAAFHVRGVTYDSKGDYDRAIADYDEAIRLAPNSYATLHERGFARFAKGDYGGAIVDYDEAIRLNPVPETYRNRGLAYLYVDQPTKAQADLKKANELNPKDAYFAIWLDIAERRSNAATHLSEAAAHLDRTGWPAPVVRMFLGQATSAAVLAAAEDPDAVKRKGQVCEANFYGGEFLLQHGEKDEAVHRFLIAARDCPPLFFETGAAAGELKALGVKQAPN
jgi:tetratricopeptide (TPR) repeat protein